MNILTIDNITKSYGVRKIFDGASFFLQEGEKAGIIGINGTGKSTLLKMIAGLEEADDGTVIKANHCLVRYLPQNPEFAPEETVLLASASMVPAFSSTRLPRSTASSTVSSGANSGFCGR